MEIDKIIRAWKDPEFRGKNPTNIEHPVGPSEVSDETLRRLGGAGLTSVGVCNGTATCKSAAPTWCSQYCYAN